MKQRRFRADQESSRSGTRVCATGRSGEPSQIAAIAAFPASDEASCITGTTIYADGGRLALNYQVVVAGKGGA